MAITKFEIEKGGKNLISAKKPMYDLLSFEKFLMPL